MNAAEDFLARFASSGSAFTLRPARPEDAGFLADLGAEAQKEAFARAGIDPAILSPEILAMQARAQAGAYRAAHPDAVDFILCRDLRPIGRVMLVFREETSLGVDIAVLPGERRGAAGLLMLRAWVETCSARGLTAQLSVHPENPARTLYRRLGFRETDLTIAPVPMTRRP